MLDAFDTGAEMMNPAGLVFPVEISNQCRLQGIKRKLGMFLVGFLDAFPPRILRFPWLEQRFGR